MLLNDLCFLDDSLKRDDSISVLPLDLLLDTKTLQKKNNSGLSRSRRERVKKFHTCLRYFLTALVTLQLWQGGVYATNYIVSDPTDSSSSPSTSSFRYAVNRVNAGTGTDIITFSNGLSGYTIMLAGELEFDQSVTLNTTSLTSMLTVVGSVVASSGRMQLSGNVGDPLMFSDLFIDSGAQIGGNGALGGSVLVEDGASLTPGTTVPTTGLTINTLVLNPLSSTNYLLGTMEEGQSDSVNTTNLTVAGTINFTALPGFENGGTYTLFTYTNLTNNNLAIGTMPFGNDSTTMRLDYSTSNQVNLIVLPSWQGTATRPQYWNGSHIVANNQVNGGTGTWDNTTTNWTGVQGLAVGHWSGYGAIFSATPGIVTLNNGQLFWSLEFDVDGYQLVQGTNATLIPSQYVSSSDSNMAVINVQGSATAIIGVPIVDGEGRGGINLIGTGTLALTGTNTYTGVTNISSQSTLSIGNGGASGSLVSNIVNNHQLLFNLSGGSTLISSIISGPGVVRQIGTGTTILMATNPYTGQTFISSGTLQIGNGGTSGDLVATLDVINNAQLAFNRSDIYTFGRVIGGTGMVDQIGSGTLIFDQLNAYTGATNITNGTLQLAASSSITLSTSVNLFNAATLDITLGGQEIQDLNSTSVSAHVLIGSQSLTMGSVRTNANFAGIISDGGLGGQIIKVGSGKQTLSGTNTFTGTATINQGTLILAPPNANVLAASMGILINGTAALDIQQGNQTIQDLNSLSATAQVVLGSSRLTLGSVRNNFYAGSIVGMGGGINKINTGSLTLIGANTYTGPTNVVAGPLVVGIPMATGSLGNTLVTVGASCDCLATAALSGTGTIAGPVIVLPNASLTPGVTQPSNTLTVGPLTISSGAMVNYKLGKPNVIGASDIVTSTGNLAINGTLNITNQGGLATGVYRLFNYSGQLTNNGMAIGIVPSHFLASAFTIDTSVAHQVNLNVMGANGSPTASQYWNGTQVLPTGTIVGGNAVWDSTTTNWTNVQGSATADWSGYGAIFAGAPGTVTVNGSQTFSQLQFQVNGYSLVAGTNGTLMIALNASENPANMAMLSASAGIQATINVPITGGGGINVAGAGTITLVGANTYHSGTLLSGGILSIGQDNSLGLPTSGLLFNGGTLQITGTTYNTSSRNVVLGSGGGTILIATGNNVFNWSGQISGVGTFSKDGQGLFILTAANNSPGLITILMGGLQIDNGGTSGSIVADVMLNAQSVSPVELIFNRSDSFAYNSAIHGNGTVLQAGTGTLILGGLSDFLGSLVVNQGTLSVSADVNMGDPTTSLTLNGGALVISASFVSYRPIVVNTLTPIQIPSGVIFSTSGATLSGTGSIVKTDSGTLSFFGTDGTNFTGNIVVQGGTLSLDFSFKTEPPMTLAAVPATFPNTNIQVQAGATLTGGSGHIGQSLTVQSGGTFQPGLPFPGASNAALQIDGSLTLNAGAYYVYGLNIPDQPVPTSSISVNPFVQVGQNVTLGGTLNLTAISSGNLAGAYRILSYNPTGTLQGTWQIGTVPSSISAANVVVQYGAVPGEVVVLIPSPGISGFVQQYWDGGGTSEDGIVTGGMGSWNNQLANFTNVNGTINSSWAGGGGIFNDVPATSPLEILLQDNIAFQSLSFQTGNYSLLRGGGNYSLIPSTNATIEVDSHIANIYAQLTGSGSVTKTGPGLLALAGGSYTGKTLVVEGSFYLMAGVLSNSSVIVSSGARLGGALRAPPVPLSPHSGPILTSGYTTGQILSNVTVQSGGILQPTFMLAPYAGFGPYGSTLQVGSLKLQPGSILSMQLASPDVAGGSTDINDFIQVLGQVTLNGYLDITTFVDPSNLDALTGSYTLLTYNPTFAPQGAGLTVRNVPAGYNPSEFIVQVGVIPGQVVLLIPRSITAPTLVPPPLVPREPDVVQYWDGAGLANDGIVANGSGIWDVTTGNWTDNDGLINSSWIGKVGYLGAPAGQITLGRNVAFEELHLSADQYQIVPDSQGAYAVTPTETGLIEVGAAMTATISAPLVGTGMVEKIGAGTLILSGNNTYQGGTVIYTGVVQIANANNLGTPLRPSSPVVTFQGGTLANTASLNLQGNVAVGAPGGTILANLPFTLAGGLSGSGTLTKSGTDILTIDNPANSAYTGLIQVASGTLNVTGALPNSNVNVQSGASLAGSGTIGGSVVVQGGASLSQLLNQIATLTMNNLTLQPGSQTTFQITQPDVVGEMVNDLYQILQGLTINTTVNVVSTIAPNTTLGGAYVIMKYNPAMPLQNPQVTLGTIPQNYDAALAQIQINPTVGQIILLLPNIGGDITQYWDGGGVPGDGIVAGSKDTLNNQLTNWTNMNGLINSSWAGGTGIFGAPGGEVTLGGNISFRSFLIQSNGYTFLPDVNNTFSFLPSGVANIAVSANVSGLFGAPISGAGGIEVVGPGDLFLSKANHSGGTFLNGGRLLVPQDSALGAPNVGLTFNGGTLVNTSSFSTARPIQLNSGGGTFEVSPVWVEGASNPLTLSGPITGVGTLTKTGGDLLYLTGCNNYGQTSIQAGGLFFGNNSPACGTINNISVNSGANAYFSYSNNVTYSGILSGGGAVTQIGPGDLTFTSANAYSGNTTVSGGRLLISADNHLGAASGNIVFNGGTLVITSPISSARSINIAASSTVETDQSWTVNGTLSSTSGTLTKTGLGTFVLTGCNMNVSLNVEEGGMVLGNNTPACGTIGPVNLAAGTYLGFEYSPNATMANPITGSGQVFVEMGSNILTLSGNNNFTGGLGLRSGTVNISSSANVGAPSNIINFEGSLPIPTPVPGDSLVQIPGLNALQDMTLPNPIDINFIGANITSQATLNLTGAINGYPTYPANAVLSIYGPGTTILSNCKPYSANMHVVSGTLQFGLNTPNCGVPGNIQVDARAIATFAYNVASSSGAPVVVSNVISGAGQVVVQLSADLPTRPVLVLSGNNTISGGISIISGTVSISDPTNLGDPANLISLDGANSTALVGARLQTSEPLLYLENPFSIGPLGGEIEVTAEIGNLYLDGPVRGTGTLYKYGAGELIFSNCQPYSGSLKVMEGSVDYGVQGMTACGSPGPINLAAPDTFVEFSYDGSTLLNQPITGQGGIVYLLSGDPAGSIALTAQNTFLVNYIAIGTTVIIQNAQNLGDPSNILWFPGSATLETVGTQTTPIVLSNPVEISGVGIFNTQASLTLTGPIYPDNPPTPGSASLQKMGPATLMITDCAAYSGNMEVAAGTLQFGNNSLNCIGLWENANIGNISGTGTNAVVAFNYWSDTVYDNVLSGTLTLLQHGPGKLFLTGINSYTGTTYIQNSELSVPGTISNSMIVVGSNGVLSGNGQVASVVVGPTGTLAPGLTPFSGGNESMLQVEDISEAPRRELVRNLKSAQAGRERIVRVPNRIARSQQVAPAPAVTPAQANENPLEAAPIVQGHPSGSEGGLALRMSSAQVGNGNILQVSQNILFSAGSVYQVRVWPDGTNNALQIAGQVGIQGANVFVNAQPGKYKLFTKYPILTAQGGIQGRFANVQTSYTFLTPQLVYDAAGQNIYLQLLRNDVPLKSFANTPNQSATASVLDTFGLTNPLYEAIVQLPESDISGALTQLGSEYGTVGKALLDHSQSVVNLLLGRLEGGAPEDGEENEKPAYNYAPKIMQNPSEVIQGRHRKVAGMDSVLWGEGFGGWAHRISDGNAQPFTRVSGGAFTGMDIPLKKNVHVGVAGGYSRTQFDTQQVIFSSATDNYTVAGYGAAYGGKQLFGLSARGGAEFTWHKVRAHRLIAFGSFWERAWAMYSGYTGQLFGEMGQGFRFRDTWMEPFVNMRLAYIGLDAFKEKGGYAALNGSGVYKAIAYSTLGIHAKHPFRVRPGFDVIVQGTLGWQRLYGSRANGITLIFRQGGTPFNVGGLPFAPNMLVIGLGMKFKMSSRAFVEVNYGGRFVLPNLNVGQDQSASASLKWDF